MQIQTSIDAISNYLENQKSNNITPNGCYVKSVNSQQCSQSKFLVPLKSIDYQINIQDGLYEVTMKQQYFNPTSEVLQVQFKFPVPLNSCINKMSAEFDGKKIEGRIKDKQIAKQEYKQAIQNGQQAVFADIDESTKDIFNLLIGNIRPNTQVSITISYICEMSLVMNTFRKLMIMSKTSPRYMGRQDYQKTKINRQIFMQSKKIITASQLKWSFKLTVKSSRKINLYKCKFHKLLKISDLQTCKYHEIIFVMEKQSFPSNDFEFLYQTQDFYKPSGLFQQNDQSSTAMLSFIPRYCNLNSEDALRAYQNNQGFITDIDKAKGQYIFIIDRSGSMYGNRIKKAKKALKDLIKSLPINSYFNVLSFGSSYAFMYKTSVQYIDQNVDEALQKIEKMSADMGGTNIIGALKSLLNQKIIQGYPRQIFLLTDGAVHNTNDILELIYKKLKYIRVHAIGIGDGASEALVKGSAKQGKGIYSFLNDKSDFSEQVLKILKQIITPVIYNIDFQFDKKIVEAVYPNPKNVPYILKNNLVNFYVVFKKKLKKSTQIKFSYIDPITNQKIEQKIKVNPFSNLSQQDSENKSMINKYTQFKIIKTLQDIQQRYEDNQKINILAQSMLLNKQINMKQEIIKRSIQNQIISKYTAFIFVGKQLQDQQLEKYKRSNLTRVRVQQSEKQLNLAKNQNFGVQKPHRFRPGTVALRQIRKYRKTTDLLIPKQNFQRLIRQIASQVSPQLKFEQSSFEVFQQVTEEFLCTLFQRSYFCAQHVKRTQLQSQDIILANKILQKQSLFDKIIAREQNSMKHYEKSLPKYRLVSRARKIIKINKKKTKKKTIKEKNFNNYSNKNKLETVLSLMKINGKWIEDKIIFLLYDINSLSANKQYEKMKKLYNPQLIYTFLIVNWVKKNRCGKKYLFLLSKSQKFIEDQIKKFEDKGSTNLRTDLLKLCLNGKFKKRQKKSEQKILNEEMEKQII